jgi:F-type H+-transporting ATPase subunit beta
MGETDGPSSVAPRRGRATAVRGSVVEVEFPDGLAAVNEALRLRDGERVVVLEVSRHVDRRNVLAVALSHTEGLARGAVVESTGRPVEVPVGPETLGRLFDVLGEPLDGVPPPACARRWPIHRPARRWRRSGAA